MAELPFFTGEEGRGHMLALLFFVSAAVITVWGAWQGTLPASGEAVLAQTAREILTRGDAITLHFDGVPVHDTPPIAPWLMSFFYLLFGVNEFAARFAFVLLSVVSYCVIYLAGREASRGWGVPEETGDPAANRQATRHSHWGTLPTGVGFLSAAVLASSPLLGKFAPHITLGLPFAFFTAIALLGWLYLPLRRAGYVLWGAGIAGGILSAGGGAFLIVLGGAFAAIVDKNRRGLIREPRFIIATAAGVVLGGLWLFPETVRGGGGFFANPLWAPLARIIHPPSNVPSLMLASLKGAWLRNLPWSIPASLAALRIIFLRGDRGRAAAVSDVDGALLVFAAVVFAPLSLSGAADMSVFLPVLPFVAILVAREITRWLRYGGKDPVKRVWTFNHVMTALFCLLMLLVVTTPVSLRRTLADPIKDVARMAPRVTPDGGLIGNFRQRYREQCARMLFYGDRSLAKPIAEASEVAAALRERPSMIFLSSSADVETLRRADDFPYEIRVLYGAGDLVLFGAGAAGGGEAP